MMDDMIEHRLDHVEQNKLKRIYQRHELKAEQRDAWLRLGDRLALLVATEGQGNVVCLSGAGRNKAPHATRASAGVGQRLDG